MFLPPPVPLGPCRGGPTDAPLAHHVLHDAHRSAVPHPGPADAGPGRTVGVRPHQRERGGHRNVRPERCRRRLPSIGRGGQRRCGDAAGSWSGGGRRRGQRRGIRGGGDAGIEHLVHNAQLRGIGGTVRRWLRCPHGRDRVHGNVRPHLEGDRRSDVDGEWLWPRRFGSVLGDVVAQCYGDARTGQPSLFQPHPSPYAQNTAQDSSVSTDTAVRCNVWNEPRGTNAALCERSPRLHAKDREMYSTWNG